MKSCKTNRYPGILTYGKYIFVGALVGVLTIIVREVIASLLPDDSPAYYAISAIFAYCIGIISSYAGHSMISFRHRTPIGGLKSSFSRFTSIAILGLISTTLLAMLFRYGLPLEVLIGKYEATFAFALATFTSSLITYSLNSKYTFASHN